MYQEGFTEMETEMCWNGELLGNATIYSLQSVDDKAVTAGDRKDLKYIAWKLKDTY